MSIPNFNRSQSAGSRDQRPHAHPRQSSAISYQRPAEKPAASKPIPTPTARPVKSTPPFLHDAHGTRDAHGSRDANAHRSPDPRPSAQQHPARAQRIVRAQDPTRARRLAPVPASTPAPTTATATATATEPTRPTHPKATTAASRSRLRRVGLPAMGIIAAVALVVVVASQLLSASVARTAEKNRVAAGVSYLQALESRDVSEVANSIDTARREAVLEAARSSAGALADWSVFDNAVILGDSRAVGFYYFNYVSKSRVMAAAGDTINIIPNHHAEVQALNPQAIFLCYGLNDMGSRTWDSVESYEATLGERVAGLREACPNATVYVSSILGVSAYGLTRDPIWGQIGDWNASIKAYCAQNGINYIDCTSIYQEFSNLQDEDGIHMQPSFYPYWGYALVSAELSHAG